MKPNFALDLSHDGLSLFHRVKGGWSLVGDVALDDPDLPRQLALLRQKAADLESGGFTTKLVIPASQILFTRVNAPGPDDIAREVQIRAGLEGVTPYPVGDLVFDWRAEGDGARVAVLARETLDEAENFAAEHRMNPVSFVARGENDDFAGEAFFGKTRVASALLGPGEIVQPDEASVPVPVPTQSGRTASAPPDPAVETAAPITEDEIAVEAATGPAEPGPDPSPDAADAALTAALASVPEPVPDLPDAPLILSGETAPPPVPPQGSMPDTPVLAPFPPTPEDTDEPGLLPPVTPVIRDIPDKGAPEASKPAGKAKRKKKPVAPPGEAKAPPTPDPAPDPAPAATPEPAATFASRRTEPAGSAPMVEPPGRARLEGIAPRIAIAGEKVKPATGRSEPRLGKSESGPSHPHVPVTAPRVYTDETGGDAPLEADGADPQTRPGFVAAARKGLTGLAAPAGKVGKVDRTAAATGAAAPPERPAAADTAIAPPPERNEAEALTVFGARQSAEVGGKPRYLGLILILVLLLAMALAAVWSMFFLADESAGLFDQAPPATAAVEAPAATPAPVPDDPVGDLIAALPVPEAPVEAPGAAIDPQGGDDTLAEMAPEPEELEAIPELLSPEAAEARYAATGIWQRAPDPLDDPGSDRIDDLYIASIDPAVVSQDAVALPPEQQAGQDPRPPSPLPPPPPGTRFDLDENGLVRATPDGALTPEGVFVYSGKPAVVPAARPGSAPAQAADPAAQPDLPRTRPRARPADLIEGNERAILGGRTRVQLAALRPRARPASIQSTTQGDTSPSVQAIATSPVPRTRPGGFAEVVARARANTDASDGSTVVAASAAATVAPSLPTRASVAQQATVQNAINLKKINLIGVYGSATSRRALVRLANGRYVKVSPGDRLNGGKVTAITATKLIYQKNGRNYTLEVLPLG